jgi:hypothetical protein
LDPCIWGSTFARVQAAAELWQELDGLPLPLVVVGGAAAAAVAVVAVVLAVVAASVVVVEAVTWSLHSIEVF